MSLPGMGGGGGGGSQTTTTRQEYSPEETAARAEIFAEGQNLYDLQKPNAGVYQGPGVVGFSDPSKQALATQMQTANSAVPTAASALASANFNLGPARYVSSNPYAADAIRAALDPIQRSFTTGTLPTLRLGAMANGSGTGTRQGVAEGIAIDALYRTLANTAGSMASGMYGQGLDASVKTGAYLPQIMSGAAMPAQQMSQVGSALETQAQNEENLAAAKRLQEINGPWELLQNLAGITSGMSNPSTTTQSNTSRPGLSASQGIGGLLSLVGLMGMFL